MNGSRLQMLLAILPVITAGLYLLGITYHQGYLEGFGLEDSMFPLTAERALFVSFIAFVAVGVKPITYGILAVGVLFTAVGIVAFLSSFPTVVSLMRRLVTALRGDRRGTEMNGEMLRLVDQIAIFFSYCIGILAVIFAFLTITLFSVRAGQEQAKREITAFKENKGPYVKIHSIELNKATKAKEIFCSPTHCAYWLGEKSLVLDLGKVDKVLAFKP